MTKLSVQKIIAGVVKKLNAFGLTCDGSYNTSDGDYGVSHYLFAYDNKGNQYKVRISDHSVTNVVRMSNEIHVNVSVNWEDNLNKTLERLEKTLFPERFDIVFTGQVIKGVQVKKYIRK
jgi:hypothetical protein